jgi:hypothetical protein
MCSSDSVENGDTDSYICSTRNATSSDQKCGEQNLIEKKNRKFLRRILYMYINSGFF